MTFIRKLLLALALLLTGVGALLFALRGPLTLRLVETQARANMQSDLLREVPDGLHLALCGAGSPLPDPQRGGPCAAVIAGRQLFVVDAGAGAARTLARLRLPPGAVTAIFLTHFHSDHIDGLGELLLQRWVGGAHETPAPVIGPTGVTQVVDGMNLAYRADHGYRVAHHGEGVAPAAGAGGVARAFEVPAAGTARVVFEGGGVVVSAFRVAHEPVTPAVGYRFDYGGRALVISGDTARSETLERVARGVDLLVHEALAPELVRVLTRAAVSAGRPRLAKITTDILDYHTSPVDAAKSAARAGAARLLFHHIVPPLPIPTMNALFLDGVREVYDGPVTLGRDGTFVQMPVTGVVTVRELL